MANKGAFLPLDDLMQQYAILPCIRPIRITVHFLLVVLMVSWWRSPGQNRKVPSRVLFYRKDLAEQYGVDTSNLSTIEDLDAFLTEAHEKVPDIITFESGFPRGYAYSDVLSLEHAKYEMDACTYHMHHF